MRPIPASRSRWWLVWCLCWSLFAGRAANAQAFGGNEYVAGGALNVAVRGPWIGDTWRRPVPRFLLAQTVSVGYERFIDCHAWNAPGHKPWADIGGRLAGYVAVELAVAILKKVRG